MLEELGVVLAPFPALSEARGHLGHPAPRVDGETVLARHAVAVGPVRGHARLCDLVHLARADLHLHPLGVAPRDGGVDRAVAVGLGLRDVVLEPARHRAPAAVDRAERAIARLVGLGDDPKAEDVRQALEGQVLLLHLAPDGIGQLGPALHLGGDALGCHQGFEVGRDPVDHVPLALSEGGEPTHHASPRKGVEDVEGEVLELLPHGLHPHAPRERRVDLHRLPRLDGLLLTRHRADRPHVVQTVGQLHDDDAQVLAHGHEQLAEVLGLLGLVAGQLEAGQLGDPIHETRDVGAEKALDLLVGGARVLHGVVEKGGDDRRIVHPLRGDDAGHRDRVGDVGLARPPGLPIMGSGGVLVRRADQPGIGARVVGPRRLDQHLQVRHAHRRCGQGLCRRDGFVPRGHRGSSGTLPAPDRCGGVSPRPVPP